MLVISATTLVLTMFMLSSFTHKAVPWLLIAIQTVSFMRTLLSFVFMSWVVFLLNEE